MGINVTGKFCYQFIGKLVDDEEKLVKNENGIGVFECRLTIKCQHRLNGFVGGRVTMVIGINISKHGGHSGQIIFCYVISRGDMKEYLELPVYMSDCGDVTPDVN